MEKVHEFANLLLVSSLLMAQTRQLAAIMFTDIVGYTALMAKDEKKAFEVLQQNLRIHQSAINKFHGKLVKELGDGILASFSTVSDALNAAISIQNQVKEAGSFELSIGIHHGEVVVEKEDVFGDAVNLASRIRALGTAGSVLFSDKVADEVKNKLEFKSVSLGRFELKNVPQPVEVFALGNAGFPVPKKSEIRGKTMRPGVAVSFSAIIVLMLAGYAALNYEKWLPAGEEKSIVVMPFEFKAPESESGYQFLAEGFQSEIINRLYLQKNLLVIAPESAQQAQLAGWSPTEIHSKLNVQYVLSGSIQKDGNRLRIISQLADLRTGAVVETKTLDRPVEDYFKMQQEVAVKVVRDVGLVVSKGLEVTQGTENLKALEFHRAALKYSFTSTSTKEVDTMVSLLRRSLQEDSMYINPLQTLALIHLFRYDSNGDTLQLRASEEVLERMSRIDKSSMSTQFAQALYSYYALRNYTLAIEQLDALLRRSPYLPNALLRKGLAYRRLGRYPEYLESFARLAKANPLVFEDGGPNRELGGDFLAHGQTQEAMVYIRKLRNSSVVADYFFNSFNHAVLEGRWDRLDSLVIEAKQLENPRFGPERQKALVFHKDFLQTFYKRDYLTCFETLKKFEALAAMDSGLFFLLLGDSAASRVSFGIAKKRQYESYKRMKGSQRGNRAWIFYAMCMAALKEPGWKEEFARIKPQLAGLFYPEFYSGYVYACLYAGENDMAFQLLKEWKEENIPYYLWNGYIRPGSQVLKDHPLLDPIRDKPGFDELWEGNHLKLKPLKIPEELQVRDP